MTSVIPKSKWNMSTLKNNAACISQLHKNTVSFISSGMFNCPSGKSKLYILYSIQYFKSESTLNALTESYQQAAGEMDVRAGRRVCAVHVPVHSINLGCVHEFG